MSRIKLTAFHLASDERGAAGVEYSILVGLISAAAIGVLVAVAAWAAGRWHLVQLTVGA
jgi:pilus assembly protein Flp/PilA